MVRTKTSCSLGKCTGFGANGQDFLKLCSAAEVVCAKLNGDVLVPSDSLA